jgi:hypothetical protein
MIELKHYPAKNTSLAGFRALAKPLKALKHSRWRGASRLDGGHLASQKLCTPHNTKPLSTNPKK